MNSICVAGIVGKDAELRAIQTGDSVCKFSVADSFKDKTIWWNCSLFGKRAESLTQYITKGSKVTVTGSVSERKWIDPNGTERTSMEIRVTDLSLQGGSQNSQPKAALTSPKPDFDDEGDIPF